MSNLETPREDRESPSPVSLSKKGNKNQNKTKKKKKSKNFLKMVRKGGIRMVEILGSSMENRSSLLGVQLCTRRDRSGRAVEEPGPVRVWDSVSGIQVLSLGPVCSLSIKE